jgi:hypothetical protein
MDFLDKMIPMVVNVHKLDRKLLVVVLIHLFVVEIEQSKIQLNYLNDDVLAILDHSLLKFNH